MGRAGDLRASVVVGKLLSPTPPSVGSALAKMHPMLYPDFLTTTKGCEGSDKPATRVTQRYLDC